MRCPDVVILPRTKDLLVLLFFVCLNVFSYNVFISYFLTLHFLFHISFVFHQLLLIFNIRLKLYYFFCTEKNLQAICQLFSLFWNATLNCTKVMKYESPVQAVKYVKRRSMVKSPQIRNFTLQFFKSNVKFSIWKNTKKSFSSFFFFFDVYSNVFWH